MQSVLKLNFPILLFMLQYNVDVDKLKLDLPPTTFQWHNKVIFQ